MRPRSGALAEIVDLGVLRQMWRPSALAGIPAALSRAEHAIASGEARHPAMKRIGVGGVGRGAQPCGQVIEALAPLMRTRGEARRLPDWIAAHRAVLSSSEASALAAHRKLRAQQHLSRRPRASFTLDLADYADLFAHVVSARREQSHRIARTRAFSYGSRSMRACFRADVVVLAGLNEGCWPQMSGPDPWLNRAIAPLSACRPQERRIGQTAHDFVSLAASAPRVILTRSKKENGSLTRPSRWISRLKALAAGAGQAESLRPEQPWLAWVAAHRVPAAAVPASRPQPRPPLAARPRRLSVTAIETWFANPYAIYARHILGLEPLRRLDETSDARDKGILYHAALHGFFQAYPGALPENAGSRAIARAGQSSRGVGLQSRKRAILEAALCPLCRVVRRNRERTPRRRSDSKKRGGRQAARRGACRALRDHGARRPHRQARRWLSCASTISRPAPTRRRFRPGAARRSSPSKACSPKRAPLPGLRQAPRRSCSISWQREASRRAKSSR